MRYQIEDVHVDAMGGGPDPEIIICELALKDEEGQISYHILEEVDNVANFFTSDQTCLARMMQGDETVFQDMYATEEEMLLDYESIFDEMAEEEKLPIYRYLTFMARADWADVHAFKAETMGAYLDEISIPDSDLEEIYRNGYEEEEDDFELPEDMDDLYRLLLSTETDHGIPSVFHTMYEEDYEAEAEQIAAMYEALDSEADYLAWKKAFLEEEYEQVDPAEYITCAYTFAGIGSYEMILPAEELEEFKGWIDSNEGASLGEVRPSKKEEVMSYLAMNAWEE